MSDDNEDKDLTRIEDLAEFLHEEGDDENLFDDEEDEEQESAAEPLPSLDDLESADDAEIPQEEPEEVASFESSEESFGDDAEFGGESDAFGGEEFGNEEFAGDDFSAGEEFSSGETFESGEDASDNDEFADNDEFVLSSEPEFETPPEEETLEEEEDPVPEPEAPMAPPPVSSYEERNDPPPQAPPRVTQNFEDLRQFAESISYGAVAQGGNPPFSIVLRRIRYQEDAQDIMIVLREHGLVNDENEKSLEQSLANGSLLISQISEYSAIYLAHRFRRFDLEIMVGLSDEIHPSHSYDADARGLVSKENIRQNVHESFDFERTPVKIDHIILTTTPTLEGYTIREYLGVVSHHSILSAQEIEEFSPSLAPSGDDLIDAIQKDIHAAVDASRDDQEIQPFGQGLETIYKEMANSLRAHALKIGANAVVGINYQLTPVIRAGNASSEVQYKVTCLGSAVWAVGD